VLDSTLSRRVDLPSGGYLMIDYAEALTVIDVNSGSFVGRGKSARLEDTITKTNLEAADEVVRSCGCATSAGSSSSTSSTWRGPGTGMLS
jgi:Rne/Rng family ribonuclease